MNRAAAAIFLAVVCSGCPKRVDFGPGGTLTDPQEVLMLLERAEGYVTTLEGDATLRVDAPQGRGSVRMFVAIARPGRVHLETLDFFDRPLGVLVTDGERFGLYQAQEGRYYCGPASPANVSRFLPVVVPSDELVKVMLGEAPRLRADTMRLETDREAGAYVLTLQAGDALQTLRVHPTHHRVLRSDVRGRPGYDLAFEDFTPAGQAVFPRRIELEAADARTRLELRYTNARLNAEPDPALFALEPPEGVPVVEVDAQGNERAPRPGASGPACGSQAR
jgi:hypothetical protein